MRLKNRILAVLLVLAMVLSMAPAVLATDKITVTLVTPAGSKEEAVAANGYFTFPSAEEYEDYQFSGWTTEAVKATDGSDLKAVYYAGEELHIEKNTTFYALYAYKDSDLDVPCFYWTENLDDYTGEYAILGYNVDYTEEDYLYDAPVVLGEKGQAVDVANDLGGEVDSINYEFYTKATNIVFYFELQKDGTYTIRNKQTGKYLAHSGEAMTFVDAPNSNSYWEIMLDSYGFEYIFSAKDNDMVLLYDYVEEAFVIYDNGKTYDGEYYPTDYFFINMYARETAIYMFTTEIENGKPEDPTDPTEPTEPEEEPERPEPVEGYVTIYNPAHDSIMTTRILPYTSSSGSTKDQVIPARAALVNEEIITDDPDAAQFLMETAENGTVTFRLPDGRYLEADGTNLRYTEDRNENTEFYLDSQDDGTFYIRLANYVYIDGKTNAEKPQYIEYYSSKEVYTTYGMGSDTSMYIFAFYPLAGETTSQDPTEPEECEHKWDDGRIIVMPTCQEIGTRLLTCTLCGETKEVGEAMILCASRSFVDLDINAWYHLGVDDMLGRGLMNGMSETEFRPDETLNRAMVATVLYRLAGEPTAEGESDFSDVEAGTWYAEAVAWAQEEGIVTGYTDNTFRPFKQITRQEMAVMLARYAKSVGYVMDTESDLTAYPDADSVDLWAADAMLWAVENGLINGVLTDGISYLKPQNNATRAQFATIMSRFLKGK